MPRATACSTSGTRCASCRAADEPLVREFQISSHCAKHFVYRDRPLSLLKRRQNQTGKGLHTRELVASGRVPSCPRTWLTSTTTVLHADACVPALRPANPPSVCAHLGELFLCSFSRARPTGPDQIRMPTVGNIPDVLDLEAHGPRLGGSELH